MSDSAEINNETARKIVEKFGKTGPRLWTPDKKPQINFALADLAERLNTVQAYLVSGAAVKYAAAN